MKFAGSARDRVVHFPLQEVQLVAFQSGPVYRQKQYRLVDRDLVPEGLYQPKHGDEVVVGYEVLESVQHHYSAPGTGQELLQREAELLKVLGPDGVLPAHV